MGCNHPVRRHTHGVSKGFPYTLATNDNAECIIWFSKVEWETGQPPKACERKSNAPSRLQASCTWKKTDG